MKSILVESLLHHDTKSFGSICSNMLQILLLQEEQQINFTNFPLPCIYYIPIYAHVFLCAFHGYCVVFVSIIISMLRHFIVAFDRVVIVSYFDVYMPLSAFCSVKLNQWPVATDIFKCDHCIEISRCAWHCYQSWKSWKLFLILCIKPLSF